MSIVIPKRSERKYEPYPEYKDSGAEWLGKIPAHWEIKPLKRVLKVFNGSTPRSSEPEYWDGDIPWATPEDLGELASSEISETKRYITQTGYASCGTNLVPAGSLVLSTRAPIGHLAIAAVALCTNQGCRSLVPRSTILSRFSYYIICAARQELVSLGQGSTFIELGKSELETVVLPFPKIEEQQAIADFLDRETAKIDELTEKKKKLTERLQEQRIALITHAVTRGLNPDAPMKDSGVDWLGKIPTHWDLKKIKHVSFIKFSSIDKHSKEDEHPVYLCNYTDVYNNDTILPNHKFMQATATKSEIKRFSLKKGDVIVTKDSEDWRDIAVSSYVSANLPDVICGYHLALIRSNLSVIKEKYLFWSFYARNINHQFTIAATGITRFGLGKYWLDNSLFFIPPIQEQQAIADYLDRETAKIDRLIRRINQAIEKLQEYRIALITATVTGKIDVREYVS